MKSVRKKNLHLNEKKKRKKNGIFSLILEIMTFWVPEIFGSRRRSQWRSEIFILTVINSIIHHLQRTKSRAPKSLKEVFMNFRYLKFEGARVQHGVRLLEL